MLIFSKQFLGYMKAIKEEQEAIGKRKTMFPYVNYYD